MSEESLAGSYRSYTATYCESCGRLLDASEDITDTVESPVHRIDIIRAIGPVEEVGETVAIEEELCDCSGQVVTRYYAYPACNVPEMSWEPRPDQFSGRDPMADALVDFSPVGGDWQEVSDISWISSN